MFLSRALNILTMLSSRSRLQPFAAVICTCTRVAQERSQVFAIPPTPPSIGYEPRSKWHKLNNHLLTRNHLWP